MTAVLVPVVPCRISAAPSVERGSDYHTCEIAPRARRHGAGFELLSNGTLILPPGIVVDPNVAATVTIKPSGAASPNSPVAPIPGARYGYLSLKGGVVFRVLGRYADPTFNS